jgi:hypothetical protein
MPLVGTEREWKAANINECDRFCLVGIMDGHMNAIFEHDQAFPTSVPISA